MSAMFGRLGEENIPEGEQAAAAEEDVLGKIVLELVDVGEADVDDSVAKMRDEITRPYLKNG